MKLGLFGRISMALTAALGLGLSMTACGGGTIAYVWQIGQQYNQIVGYKVDDYSGNLTQILHSPFSVSGTNPVSIVVKAGGRFLYVISQGTGGNPGDGTCSTSANGTTTPLPGPCHAAGSGISLYSVGGDGVLTFEQNYSSEGFVPVWAQMDGSGSYLYVVDKYAPETFCPTATSSSNCPAGTAYNGSVTAFAADPSTGRLQLVSNLETKDYMDPTHQLPLLYFPVGPNPIMTKLLGGCLFTADAGSNAIYPYNVSSGGQLTVTATAGEVSTGAVQLTSVNGANSNLYLTDANNGSSTNYIIPYTVSSGCALALQTGGIVQNAPGTINPSNTLLDNSGKFLFVLNKGIKPTPGVTTNPSSSVSAFLLVSGTGQLQLSATQTPNPFNSGSGPTCMVEDPNTNQWLYSSSMFDGTITGYGIDDVHGTLSTLVHGSTFPGAGVASCLAISGNID